MSNVGDYYSGPPGDLDQEPDEDWVRSRQNEGLAYQEWDEDADVDESGEVLGFFCLFCCSVDQAGKRDESDNRSLHVLAHVRETAVSPKDTLRSGANYNH